MKTTNVIQETVGNEGVSDEALEMSIDESSSIFLMDALGKLYSQPARAALREYLANGIDAHVEAGGTLPAIEITLASKDSRLLCIRDYGNGMSEDDFDKILRRYGASTKRHSNKLTGGFGLGAKAGFALADEFHMTSFQNGLKIKVRIFKNANGKGFIEVIDRATTSEADGLLVEVPVPFGNLEELSYDSLVADHFFAAYHDSEIKVVAAEQRRTNSWSGSTQTIMKSIPIEDSSLWNPNRYEPLEYGGAVVGWIGKASVRNSPIRAIIGRVNYKIKYDSTADSYRSYSFSNLTSYSETFGSAMQELSKFGREIILNLPIGSVDLPSSREEITYSERSLKTIVAVSTSVHRVVDEQVQRSVNGLETGFSALKEIVALHEDNFWKANKLTWRGLVAPIAAADNKFTEKSHAVRFLKTDEARKSLTINTVTSSYPKEIRTWTNSPTLKTLMVVAKDKPEFELALKKIKSNINDYHRSKNISKNVQVFLLLDGDSLNLWFEQGETVTLDDFIEIGKKYRAVKRAEAKALAQARAGNVNLSSNVKVSTATREAFHIELNRKLTGSPFILEADTEQSLLGNSSDFYYLSRAEVKDISAELSNLFPTKQGSGSRAVIDASYARLLPTLKEILGEDKKLVFIPATRNMEEFNAMYPNVPSVVSALRTALQVEWNHVVSGNKKETYFSDIFWIAQSRNKVALINQFFGQLSAGEAYSMNSDLKDINDYMKVQSRGGTSRLNVLCSELLGRTFTETIYQWMEAKIQLVSKRYPLLTLMTPYGQEWDILKPEMIRYLKTC